MKNYIFIIITCFAFFFLSCANNNSIEIKNEPLNVYCIADIKEIAFPLDSTKDGKPLDAEVFYNRVFDYCFIDNIETLIIPINRDRLAFYDLKSYKEYHSVPISKSRDIINFSFVNKDSIFVFYSVNQISYGTYEPIFMHLFDFHGNIKPSNYSIDTTNFTENTDLRLPFIIEANLQPTIINGNIFFMTQTSSINNIGSNDYINKHFPLFAYYNSKTKKIKTSKSIEFPNIEEGIFYKTNYKKINYCTSSNNLPLLRFFYSSTLYEWDYKNDKIYSYSLKSRIIDSIQPLASGNSLPESLEATYGSIFYDKENELYYSFLHLNNSLYGNYNTLLILADKNFNYLGEIFNPKLGGNIEFYKGNIVTYYYSNDSIHVKYKKLVKSDIPLESYLDSVQNILNTQSKNIKNNLSNIDLKENVLLAFIQSKYPQIEESYVLLTLYASSGCPSCILSIKELLNKNHTILADLPFYFIYSGTASEVKDISNYEHLGKIKMVQDSLAIVKNLSISENKFSTLDPRITVVENGIVIIDTVYNALKFQSELIPTIMKNLGLESQ